MFCHLVRNIVTFQRMIDCLLHVAPVACATVDISVDSIEAMLSWSVVYLTVRLLYFHIFVGSVCVCVGVFSMS
jgi:hypothetical protein